MTLVRVVLALSLAVVAVTSAVPIPADHNPSDSGTNVNTESLFVLGTGTPLLADCDDDGVGGVRLCETLQVDDHPDRVAIAVRDELRRPVGFLWELRGDTTVLNSGSACGHVNAIVPHTGHGGFGENATELVIMPDLETSLFCANIPTSARTVAVVTWRYHSPLVV